MALVVVFERVVWTDPVCSCQNRRPALRPVSRGMVQSTIARTLNGAA